MSLIITVKNEEATIAALLESIIKQTKSPNEIVIVDAGSSDSTVNIIENYKDRLPIKLIISPKANIPAGRNIAIKNTSQDIIACTDGGCVLHERWFENIVKPLETSSDVSVVSGVYLPLCKNDFEQTMSKLILPEIDTLTLENYLPASRSVAFRKNVWAEVGGYPEWLNTAEDTSFDLKALRLGKKFVLAKDAIVFWWPPSKLKGLFKQFFGYARGDGSALLFPLKYFGRYALIAFFVSILFLAPLNPYVWLFAIVAAIVGLWLMYLRRAKPFSFRRMLIATSVALTCELALSLGFFVGLCRYNKRF